MKHTREPWAAGWGMDVHTYHNGGDVSKETCIATTHQTDYSGRLVTCDAYRIVECVNACAGIEDPASAINEAREALELALEVIEATGPGSYPIAEDAIADALAKLKGGAE